MPQAAALWILRRGNGQAGAAGQGHVIVGDGVADQACRRGIRIVVAIDVAAGELGVDRIAIRTQVGLAYPFAVGAVLVHQHVRFGVFGVDDEVVFVRVQVALAEGQRGAVLLGVAVAGNARVAFQGQAFEVLAQDDVDDAGDGVRAVGRRGAILENLDALDDLHRHGGQVGKALLAVIGARERRHAPAIEQHQGRGGAQAAQRDRRGTGGKAVAEACRQGTGAIGRQRLQVFGDGGLARFHQVIAGDDLYRRCSLGRGPFDARSCNFHPLHIGVLRHCRHGHHAKAYCCYAT